VINDDLVKSSPNLFVMPDALLAMRFGGFSVGLGIAVGVFVLQGPGNDEGLADTAQTRGVEIRPADSQGTIFQGVKSADSAKINGERLYGTHVLLVPSLTAGYMF
jgi:hypothetical protein